MSDESYHLKEDFGPRYRVNEIPVVLGKPPPRQSESPSSVVPAVLTVLEKAEAGRSEYGIERDEGLVTDLKLFARTTQLVP